MILYTDGSPHGISAIFLQSMPNIYDHIIITYSLRALTSTEQ